MDCQDYITEPAERKKGQHLQREERGAIQHLKCQGYSNRAIAREIGCSPSTVANELRRGTPPRKSNKGRKPGYSAKRGEAVVRSLLKKTENYIAVQIPGKDADSVLNAMQSLKEEYGNEFSQVFKTIVLPWQMWCRNFILPCRENHYGFFVKCPTSLCNQSKQKKQR